MQSYRIDLESNFMNVFQRKQSVHLHEESKIVRGLETEQNGGYQGLGGVRRRRH